VTTSTPSVPMAEPIELAGLSLSGRVRKRLTSPMATVAAIVIAILWTIPTFGLFVNSLRPRDEIVSSGWWTAFKNPDFTLENYNTVLFKGSSPLVNFVVNSFVVVIPSVLFPLLFATLAAYALSWMKWPGRDWVFIGIFALQIVPLQMALIPLLQFVNGFGLEGYQKFSTVWLAHTVFALPLAIFLLHNFMSALPNELIEAARVDGADHARIFRSVALPLIIPALASFAIFQFLWVWNDLLVSLVFIPGGDTAPLTVRLGDLVGTRGEGEYLLPAAAFVAIIVPMCVFLGLQRFFVRGLLAGGLKG
jgi:alpha-glucoside transport system permease protein